MHKKLRLIVHVVISQLPFPLAVKISLNFEDNF